MQQSHSGRKNAIETSRVQLDFKESNWDCQKVIGTPWKQLGLEESNWGCNNPIGNFRLGLQKVDWIYKNSNENVCK